MPWPSAPLKAQVLEVAHVQGKAPSSPDRVRVRARVFRWAGCSLSCEMNCETTGCETSCESYFQPDNACWTCHKQAVGHTSLPMPSDATHAGATANSCRICHAPVPHADNGMDCTICH